MIFFLILISELKFTHFTAIKVVANLINVNFIIILIFKLNYFISFKFLILNKFNLLLLHYFLLNFIINLLKSIKYLYFILTPIFN